MRRWDLTRGVRWLPLATCGLLGCDGASDVPLVVVRDSLGVEIVEIDRSQVAAGAQVDPSPEWVLGGDEFGEEGLLLHQVTDVTLSGDSVAWIAHWGSQEVLGVWLPSGPVVRIGREGEGPGEFQDLQRVWVIDPGRVGAFDRARQRYLEFGWDGTLLSELALPDVSDGRHPRDLYRTVDGAGVEHLYLAVITMFPSDRAEGEYRGQGPLVHIVGTGDAADTLTWLGGRTTFVGRGVAGHVLFGATTYLSEGPDGLWVGDSAEAQVMMWHSGQVPIRIVRWSPTGDTKVTEDRKLELWDRLESSLPPGEREMVPRLRTALPVAERVPEFGSLHASRDGRLWIGPFIDPEREVLEEPWPAQDWLVVDIDAREAWQVRTPEGLQVHEVGEDFVLGVHRDHLGVETVRLHRWVPDGSP